MGVISDGRTKVRILNYSGPGLEKQIEAARRLIV
jgi:hypothetical protein